MKRPNHKGPLQTKAHSTGEVLAGQKHALTRVLNQYLVGRYKRCPLLRDPLCKLLYKTSKEDRTKHSPLTMKRLGR